MADDISALLVRARQLCGAKYPKARELETLMCTLPKAASIAEQRSGVGVLWSYLRASLNSEMFERCARRAAVRISLGQWGDLLQRDVDDWGRLKRWPSQYRSKQAALAWLAGHLEVGTEYHEREISGLLQRWHTFGDPALLRRELFDRGWVDRSRDGRRYWRVEAV